MPSHSTHLERKYIVLVPIPETGLARLGFSPIGLARLGFSPISAQALLKNKDALRKSRMAKSSSSVHWERKNLLLFGAPSKGRKVMLALKIRVLTLDRAPFTKPNASAAMPTVK